jgi:hypothetical protein
MKKILFSIIAIFVIASLNAQVVTTFTSSGTWVCPPGITSITVQAWGGGGAGGGASTTNKLCGGGGGGGAYASSTVAVTPGNSYNIVVGSGGTASTGNGGNGGNSTFNATTVVAAGGTGGTAGGNGPGGAGGTVAASTGTTRYAGGAGVTGVNNSYGGGGGAGAGTGANGAAGATSNGGTGVAPGGSGGAGASTSGAAGTAGSTYGGGGGGAWRAGGIDYSGGAGAAGQVVITYSCPAITLPYTESFEGITAANMLPTCWAATNLGTKVYTYTAATGSYNQAARTGSKFASFKYSCDDWLFSPGITLTAGTTYSFSFWYVTDGNSGWTTLEAKFGNAQNSGAMTGTVSGCSVSSPTNTSYVQLSGTFTPSSTGTYYIGIHCLSNASPWYLSIDDINLAALAACAGTPTAGSISAATSTFTCSGSTALTLAGQTTASGISIQWQSSPAGMNTWSNVGTNSASYTTPTLTASTDYRCVVTCTNSGLSATTAIKTITINANVPGAAAASPTSLCLGSTTALSITGSTVSNSTYQWQSSPDNATWTDIAGATAATYTATPTANTYYRCKITCTAASSNTYTTSVLVSITGMPTYATLPYSESFEGPWLSVCDTRESPTNNWSNVPKTGNNSWRRDDDGAAAAWGSATSYGYTPGSTDLAHSARFHSGNASSGLQGKLDLYVNCSPAGTKTLMFDAINTSGTDQLAVMVSTDGGVTFPTTLGTLGVLAAWTTTTYSITSTSATTVIRFIATADYGSTDIGLDNIKVLMPCSGTPTAGTSVATPNAVCPGSSSVLSLTGSTLAGGITYQWQSASALAGPYSNIGAATSSTYTATPAVNTYYRCVVTCTTSGLSANSSPVLVSMLLPTYATLPLNESFETWVSRCATNDVPSISWLNAPLTGNNSWRRDDQGADAAWTSTTSYIYSPVFSDGAHSARFHSGSATAGLIGTLDLYVNCSPAGTKTLMFDVINTSGTDGLTVLQSTDGGATFPTTLGTYGVLAAWTTQSVNITTTSATTVIRFKATSDYGSTDIGLDNVKVLLPCTGTPTAGIVTATPVSVCPGSSSVLALSGYSVAGGISFQWQSASAVGGPYSNIGAATANTYTATPAATTYYRCVVTCTSSGLTATTSPVSVTVLLPSYATLPVIESFESWSSRCSVNDIPSSYWLNSPATGNTSFRRDDQGSDASWSSPTSYVYSPVSTDGVHSARFHSGSASNGTVGTLDLYVNCSPAGTKTLMFDIINTSQSNSPNDKIIVKQSTDGGATFPTTLGTYNAVIAAWTTQTINVTSTSATTVIRFEATADYGSTDMGLDYVRLLLPCSGAPTAGSAVANPSIICPSGSSVLSLTGNVVAGGLTYQWQSSPDNSTWTNIGGATAMTYTATPAAATYYRCRVTCSGTNSFSASALVTITSGPSYATLPVYESFEGPWLSWCNTRELPSNNWANSPNTANNSWRREDDGAAAAWTSLTSYLYSPVSSDLAHSARFHSGAATSGLQGKLDLYVNCSPAGTKTMFFDVINTSGTDVLTVLMSTDGGTTFPTTLGTYGVLGAWTTQTINVTSNSATTVIRFQATSDYGSTDIGLDNLRIVLPCSGTPTAGTATSNLSNFCNSGTPTLTVAGYSIAGGLTFQWQSSPSNSPYSWTDIVGGTTTTFTAPAIAQTTYYRCVVSCGSNNAATNVVTVTNDANIITSTNSPVTVVCNTTATLTATATGGTVYWYNTATGGTALGSGNSYNTNATANTTYYCAAGNGGTNYLVGKPTSPMSDGYYGSTNTGLVFDALTPFTLVSVNVYVQTAGSTVAIQLQDNTGLAIGSPVTFNSCPAGLNTLTLNLSIPIGTGYRLVSNNSTNLARDFSGSFPYTQAGICSITGGYLSGSSTTYYFFYNWVISTGCESSPRTPVNVVVNGGITPPVCSTGPTPNDGTIAVCPVATTLSWGTSTASCQAATSYKLFFGTDAAATNIINGLNVGDVTSYNVGNLTGNTMYYWKVVPTNSAGDASGCTVWTFTTAANPGATCAGILGTGVINVPFLPWSSGAGTTAGAVNDLTSTNMVTCGSTSYTTGEDQVFIFTPTTSGNITITLTSTGTSTGLMLYDGCPLAAGSCGATPGSCIGYAQSSTGNKTLTSCVTAGVTYYLVLDSYASPANNPYSDLYITAPFGTGVPANDLPCNATTMLAGDLTPGDNTCSAGSGEPAAPSCWTNGLINTVWFKFQAPASGTAKIKTMVGTLLNTQIAVYSGTCGSTMAYVACNDNVAACGSSSYYNSELSLSGLTPGAWYYIVVDGYSDLTGTFSIVWVDGSTPWPLVPGQDCAAEVPVCAQTFTIGNPGYQAVGNNCDFGTDYCLLSGERGSAWYEIKVNANGNLMFTLEPNDVVPAIGTAGTVTDDGTDYDFAIWKKTGSGAVTCAQILSGAATPLACNYSYIGITGLYTGGNTPPGNAYTNHTYTAGSYDAAFEPPLTVTAGETYWLVISNFSNSLSGVTINFTNSTNGFNFNVPNPLIWTGGAANTDWFNPLNWGNCSQIPDTNINCVIAASSVYQPVINAPNARCKSITINPGASLSISGFMNALDVYGNYNNQGTLNATVLSSVNFKGGAYQRLDGIMVTPSEFFNVVINKPAGNVITDQNVECDGSFTTSNNTSIMNMSNNNLTVGANFTNFNGNTTFIPGTGTLFFDGSGAQTYTNTNGTLILNNVTMNHTGTGVTIANNMVLGASGVLTLNSGKIITNAFMVDVRNNAPTACTSGNNTSFVQGNLNRAIQPTGSYDFPVGHTSKGYQRANFNFTSATAVTSLYAFFTPYGVTPGPLGTTECGWTYDHDAIDNGYWTLNATPAAQKNTGNYTCTLYNQNYTNSAGTNNFTVMSDHLSTGWQLLNGDGSNGTCVACGIGMVIRSNMRGFSKFGTAASGTTPLPIELLSFTGRSLDEVNLLEWATASEINNDYFLPEKSADGITFTEMKRVDAAGNSNQTLYYDQVDENPYSPVTYYKLKQVDFDGQYTYSDIIAVARGNTANGAEIVNVYPNPANSEINIEIVSPFETYTEIELVDIFGRTILSKGHSMAKGRDVVVFDISPLATGVYFARVKFAGSGNSSVHRFVKQ